jgi:predicted DNA-binding transcriptional regulator AlpA
LTECSDMVHTVVVYREAVMAQCLCPVCSNTISEGDEQWLSRKGVAELTCLKERSIDRLDADESPDRTFPRSKRIKLPGRKRGFRRWLKSEIIAWMRLEHNS